MCPDTNLSEHRVDEEVRGMIKTGRHSDNTPIELGQDHTVEDPDDDMPGLVMTLFTVVVGWGSTFGQAHIVLHDLKENETSAFMKLWPVLVLSGQAILMFLAQVMMAVAFYQIHKARLFAFVRTCSDELIRLWSLPARDLARLVVKTFQRLCVQLVLGPPRTTLRVALVLSGAVTSGARVALRLAMQTPQVITTSYRTTADLLGTTRGLMRILLGDQPRHKQVVHISGQLRQDTAAVIIHMPCRSIWPGIRRRRFYQPLMTGGKMINSSRAPWHRRRPASYQPSAVMAFA